MKNPLRQIFSRFGPLTHKQSPVESAIKEFQTAVENLKATKRSDPQVESTRQKVLTAAQILILQHHNNRDARDALKSGVAELHSCWSGVEKKIRDMPRASGNIDIERAFPHFGMQSPA